MLYYIKISAYLCLTQILGTVSYFFYLPKIFYTSQILISFWKIYKICSFTYILLFLGAVISWKIKTGDIATAKTLYFCITPLKDYLNFYHIEPLYISETIARSLPNVYQIRPAFLNVFYIRGVGSNNHELISYFYNITELSNRSYLDNIYHITLHELNGRLTPNIFQGIPPVAVEVIGTKMTNDSLREFFTTGKILFVVSGFFLWEFVELYLEYIKNKI